MKGLIVIPNTNHFTQDFVASWTQLYDYSMRNLGLERLEYNFTASCLIYSAREDAAKKCLKEGFDWLFFLDSDMIPKADTIQRLLEWSQPIVSAMAFKRNPPYEPCFYPKLDYDEMLKAPEYQVEYPTDWDRGIAEVDGVGMACCLIRREVFEQTPKPWFFPEPILGEDLAFCMRAKKAGFSIHVDTRVDCGHQGLKTIGENEFREHWRLYADRDSSSKK